MTAIRFKDPPTVYGGVFQLVDNYLTGWPPKGIYCVDVSTSWFVPAGSAIYSSELMRSALPFTELILAQILNGAHCGAAACA